MLSTAQALILTVTKEGRETRSADKLQLPIGARRERETEPPEEKPARPDLVSLEGPQTGSFAQSETPELLLPAQAHRGRHGRQRHLASSDLTSVCFVRGGLVLNGNQKENHRSEGFNLWICVLGWARNQTQSPRAHLTGFYLV